jgi:hypothetical protein
MIDTSIWTAMDSALVEKETTMPVMHAQVEAYRLQVILLDIFLAKVADSKRIASSKSRMSILRTVLELLNVQPVQDLAPPLRGAGRGCTRSRLGLCDDYLAVTFAATIYNFQCACLHGKECT